MERGLDPFQVNLVVADPTRSVSTICLAITPAMKQLGVKNRYRIIDSRRQRVWIYEFEKSDAPAIYTFEDTVPVGIFGGECKVDFVRFYDRMRALYETM